MGGGGLSPARGRRSADAWPALAGEEARQGCRQDLRRAQAGAGGVQQGHGHRAGGAGKGGGEAGGAGDEADPLPVPSSIPSEP